MPSRHALAVVTAAPLLLACVDFVPTEATGPTDPGEPEPATFSGTVQLSTGSQRLVRLTALFFPGRDSLGVIRQVTSDAVTVLGQRIVAQTRDRDDGSLVFDDEWQPRPEDGREAARLRGPEIAGREPPPPSVEFGFCPGEEPYDLTISPDDTLRFQVSCQRPTQTLTEAHWTLIVREDGPGAQTFGVSGTGIPPVAVELPAEILNADARSEFTATLRVFELWGELAGDDDGYQVFVTVVSESSWTLRWK